MKNKRHLLLGDEVIAQGALDAGISGAYAYPGTPSTEIFEYIQKAPEAVERGIHREWSTNEKTALEEALGMSYAGKRTLVSMKHVGLNVAADPFVNSAITGVNGGLVIIVADDPSMHSSQNEQDSRNYAKFAGIPLLEPSSQQEAYDMVYSAFDTSEAEALPILIRITTRLAHSRADIVRREVCPQQQRPLPTDPRQFTLLPGNARRNYAALIEKQPHLEALALESEFNTYTDADDHTLGVIATGIAANYVAEVFAGTCPHPLLKIGQYPVPIKLIEKMQRECDAVLVVEEGAPFVEDMMTGIGSDTSNIHGRLDGVLPRTGELTPDHLASALQMKKKFTEISDVVKPRPPQLCKGCSHRDSYAFLKEATAEFDDCRVFGDIGCYTLGALPPFNAIDACVDMGASITMAKGAADAGMHPAICVIGDSTFTHSGMTGLLDAVYENTRMVVMILDNGTTAMTGMQDSMATGRLESICEGLGVASEHIRVVVPLSKNHDENVRVLREEIEYNGISVVIPRRACIHLKRKM